jgi:Resolvase, N terminal domain
MRPTDRAPTSTNASRPKFLVSRMLTMRSFSKRMSGLFCSACQCPPEPMLTQGPAVIGIVHMVIIDRRSVDRLGRSLQDLVGFLSELHALKIDLFLRQQGLDTTTPAGKAMFQMMGVFAEFERAMIQERVRAGLARARGEGKRLGRPPIAPALEKRILEALATPGRPGVRVIAKQFGVNPGTVQRISRPFEQDAVAL